MSWSEVCGFTNLSEICTEWIRWKSRSWSENSDRSEPSDKSCKWMWISCWVYILAKWSIMHRADLGAVLSQILTCWETAHMLLDEQPRGNLTTKPENSRILFHVRCTGGWEDPHFITLLFYLFLSVLPAALQPLWDFASVLKPTQQLQK